MVEPPLWKMWVSWDDYFPRYGKMFIDISSILWLIHMQSKPCCIWSVWDCALDVCCVFLLWLSFRWLVMLARLLWHKYHINKTSKAVHLKGKKEHQEPNAAGKLRSQNHKSVPSLKIRSRTAPSLLVKESASTMGPSWHGPSLGFWSASIANQIIYS